MLLDLRFPMGLLFMVLGGLLTAYGLLGDQSVYQSSLGVNVNVWAGLGILVFGTAMFVGGWRAMARGDRSKEQGARSKRA
jgi:hypothetical protein